VIGEDGVSAGQATFTEGQLANMRDFGYCLPGSFSFSHSTFLTAKKGLRVAWRGEPATLAEFRHRLTSQSFHVFAFPHSNLEKVAVQTQDLLTFIHLSFLMDYDTGRARVCANERCARPYFLKQRVDQRCCSHRCAVEKNNARMAVRLQAKKKQEQESVMGEKEK
jgi:hypothetical protein